ncbi:MAG: hypothetical protein HY273_08905 [Gammaproteobacteria bacterium]|nr:hypothetical protein [Gammaproteobacteria bacterium]
MKTLFRFVLLPLVLVAALGAGYLWLVVTWSYSNGERAGWVQKLSKKGWLCKTWEGELSMVAMPGSMPEKFLFTVHDDALAGKLNQAMGKRVALSYEQHIGIPSTCFGETQYFITAVKVVE